MPTNPLIDPASTSAKLMLTADTPWIVLSDQPEPIERALEDVKRDWYKVLGHLPVILSAPPKDWSGPLIYLGLGAQTAFTGLHSPPTERESFVLQLQSQSNGNFALVATGADLRGCIYAAYAFSEQVLGVDPWWFWADHEPTFRGTVDVPAGLNLRAGPPTFKYRGWFINDEDLLSGFSPDPLRENVFSLEILDRICETLLRLRGNLLVPATFPFPDERCQELTACRGLVLNMHHILVTGLNTYRWPKDVPFSHTRHPEIMERYWQQCIDAFKDKEVVWTVGYRGKHDYPFWKDEPSIVTPANRGAVITRAIARQVEMIRLAQPDAPIIANMWDEGADLYRQGLIQLPLGVTLVWPDDGTGLIRDKGEARPGQGIYYHTAMFMWWFNQLSEMVPPARIFRELGRFAQAGATEFFLVNVSDIRPVPLSTECAMRLAWDVRPQLERSDQENQTAYLLAWCQRQFGVAAAPSIAALYHDYFNVPAHQDDVRNGDNAPHSHMRKLSAEALPLLRAGQVLPGELLTRATSHLEFAGTNIASLSILLRRAESATTLVPPNRHDFYQAHLLTAVGILLHSQRMLAAYCQALHRCAEGDSPGALSHLEQALAEVEAVFGAMRLAERGKWAGWYAGEGIVGLDGSRDQLRLNLAALAGEPAPPVRPRRAYEHICRYQERFRANFPLLYGTPRSGPVPATCHSSD